MRKKMMEEAVAEYNRTVELDQCPSEYFEMASELCDYMYGTFEECLKAVTKQRGNKQYAKAQLNHARAMAHKKK